MIWRTASPTTRLFFKSSGAGRLSWIPATKRCSPSSLFVGEIHHIPHLPCMASGEGDRWEIRYDGKEYPYDSNSDAVVAANKAAEVLTEGIDLK